MIETDSVIDISVIIPTHNVGAWVEECLTSVLNESALALEVIVVDDGSTDDTVDIVKDVASRDDRVRFVRAFGSGGAQARDQGVELARGEYIAFVDGDDIVPDNAYASMLSSARTSGSDLVIGRFFKYHLGKIWHPTRQWRGFDEARTAISLAEHPSLISNRACWNRLARREWWIEEGIRFPSVPRSNDIVPMTKALTRARSIDVVTDVVYIYRDRPGGSSMTARSGAAESLESYLSQEVQCRALVSVVSSEVLLDEYDNLLFARDGWVHICKFMAGGGWRDSAPEQLTRIETWVRTLVSRVADRALPGVRSDVRWVWASIAQGDWEGASKIAAALQTPPKTRTWPQAAVWLALAQRLHDAGELPSSVLREVLVSRVLDPIGRGRVAQSVDLALALADASPLINELFAGDNAEKLTDEQRTLVTMLENGIVGQPVPKMPKLTRISVAIESDQLRIKVSLDENPQQLSGLTVTIDEAPAALEIARDGAGAVIARVPLAALNGDRELQLLARIDTPVGILPRRLRLDATQVATKPDQPFVAVTASGGVRIVPPNSDASVIGADELVARYLNASVESASIDRRNLHVAVTADADTELRSLRLWREVNGAVLSRPLKVTTDADGRVLGVRRAEDLTQRRWSLVGVFNTPIGPVEYPLSIRDGAAQGSAADYVVRVADSSTLVVVDTSESPRVRAGLTCAPRSLCGSVRRLVEKTRQRLRP